MLSTSLHHTSHILSSDISDEDRIHTGMNYPRGYLQQQQQQQQRRHRRHLSVAGVATRAVVAYGTYKIASWAWSKLNKDDKEDEEVEENTNLFFHRPGGDVYGGGDGDIGEDGDGDGNGADIPTPIRNYRTTTHHDLSRKFKRIMTRKRNYQLMKCHEQTYQTMQSFMANTSIKSNIESFTDYSHCIKTLKQLRKQKQQQQQQQQQQQKGQAEDQQLKQQQALWNEIKIKSMVRLMTTLYVHNQLYLLLLIQVHILGGRIFHQQIIYMQQQEGKREQTNNSSISRSSSNEALEVHLNPAMNNGIDESISKSVLMNTFEYFFHHGIHDFLNYITSIVEKETHDWIAIRQQKNNDEKNTANDNGVSSGDDSTLGFISMEDFIKTVEKIRSVVEEESFFLPANQQQDQEQQEQQDDDRENNTDISESNKDLVRLIIDETLDIMESPVYHDAKENFHKKSFQMLNTNLKQVIFQTNGDDDSGTRTIPLVNIFSKLKTVANTFYDEPVQRQFENEIQQEWGEKSPISYPNIYLKALDKWGIVKELGDVSFHY